MVTVLTKEQVHTSYWYLGVARLKRVCDNKGWSAPDIFDAIITGVLGKQGVCDNTSVGQMWVIARTMHLFASYNQRKIDGKHWANRLHRAIFHAVED